jgi:hypothetical protein
MLYVYVVETLRSRFHLGESKFKMLTYQQLAGQQLGGGTGDLGPFCREEVLP